MADSETTWQVLQVLVGEDVRNAYQFQQFNFNLVRACGLSGARTLNTSSNIRFKAYEVHAIDKIKKLLFEAAIKPRNTNPVFLERELLKHKKATILYMCTIIQIDVYVCTHSTAACCKVWQLLHIRTVSIIATACSL